ncbi:hypothetical protein QUF74_00330 [Candidatus Halobeggiatoa sp. HSG11]|nr:hypothetical protein [Candidatus Halobeggiatoa sp. HSG11]
MLRIFAILTYIILILTAPVLTADDLSEQLSCTSFEGYQKALEQLKYARDLVEAQQMDNQILFEKTTKIIADNKKLMIQNQELISLLQQKTKLINKASQNELNVDGMVSADVFKSKIKQFSPYNTVEPDAADKDFYKDSECISGTITSALVNNKDGSNLQAAICTCLQSKRGRGWFCWN